MRRRSASNVTPLEQTMSDGRTLSPWLRRFLVEYIVTERQLARNTQMGYPTTRSTASMNSCPGTQSRHQIPKLTADPPGAVTPDVCGRPV